MVVGFYPRSPNTLGKGLSTVGSFGSSRDASSRTVGCRSDGNLEVTMRSANFYI